MCLHKIAVDDNAIWDWNDLAWLVTRAIHGGPCVLLGLSAFAVGSACTLGASCYIWMKNINQAGAIRHQKFGRVKVLRYMSHPIPDSVESQTLLQNPRDPRLRRLIAEALRDQGKMQTSNSRRSGERPSSSTPQSRSPPTSFPRSWSSSAKLSHPINSYCYFPVIVAILMRFPFLIYTCNTFLLDQSLYPHPLASKALASAAVTRGKSFPKGTNCSFSLSLFEVVLRAAMYNMLEIRFFCPRCSPLNPRVNGSGDSRNSDNPGTLQPTKDHLCVRHLFPVVLRQSVCDLFADDIGRTVGRGGDRL